MPSVRMMSGIARNVTIGLTSQLTTPKTAPATTTAHLSSKCMPSRASRRRRGRPCCTPTGAGRRITGRVRRAQALHLGRVALLDARRLLEDRAQVAGRDDDRARAVGVDPVARDHGDPADADRHVGRVRHHGVAALAHGLPAAPGAEAEVDHLGEVAQPGVGHQPGEAQVGAGATASCRRRSAASGIAPARDHQHVRPDGSTSATASVEHRAEVVARRRRAGRPGAAGTAS